MDFIVAILRASTVPNDDMDAKKTLNESNEVLSNRWTAISESFHGPYLSCAGPCEARAIMVEVHEVITEIMLVLNR